jgi:transposase
MTEIDNEIIHRYQGGQSLRAIARDLNISRHRARHVVQQYQQAREVPAADTPPASLGLPPIRRGSQLDAFDAHIVTLLGRYPRLTATRVWEELKAKGFQGGYSIVKERVRRLRQQPVKPLTVRFETGPGAQAQMDWSVYELNFTQEGRRRVNLFSYLLSYSRRQYICFTERQDFDATVREHIRAFEYLRGVAATCLYDNMKVVVTRWEDDQPIYNTRFLTFATHYGYRPWACRPRRPETKGKVERPFHYVEVSLLNGRTFRSLEHLNEVTRWWLAEVADVRTHGTTNKRPIDAYAEEQSYLLPLPARHYDTAQVVYRLVAEDGTIVYANNRYSVPWQLVGEMLPVRVTETETIVYNRYLQPVAQHPLWRGAAGHTIRDAAHSPPSDQSQQLQHLRERFIAWGDCGSRFLEGLLKKQRYAKRQAQRVLTLLSSYQHADGLAALERAVRYHAFSHAALERILAHQATPKPSWQILSRSEQEKLEQLMDEHHVPPRQSGEYQSLLFSERDDDGPAGESRTSGDPSTDLESPEDPQDLAG